MITIDWKPDKISNIPLYRQIVTYIKQKIANGDWTVGTKLPPQREMAKLFDVNRSTVIEALEELKAEGLLEGKGGNGTRIVNNTWSLLTSSPPPNWQKYIEGGIHQPNHPTIQVINRLEYAPDIIRLGTGELSPELYPASTMKTVLNRISEKIHALGYEEPLGMLELRQCICDHVKKYGIQAAPSSVLIVSGALQALQLIAMGILHPGSTVYLEKPSYLKSLHVFQSAGMRLVGAAMDNEGILPKEIMKNFHHRGTALLYTIPSFHNPTGTVMSMHRRKEVLALCERERLPIIEDDVYRELWMDEEPLSSLKVMDHNGMVLYLGSLSKSLAPGLRIGWLIGPEPVIERLGDIKMQTDYGSSSLSQWAATEWISSGMYEQHLVDIRGQLKIRRAVALKGLETYFSDIAVWNAPKGGFYIWVKLKSQIAQNKLFTEAWKEGILINPGNIYDFSHNQFLRISYAYASLEDLDKGLKRLSELIQSLQDNH
ncbi:MAG: PLP-dependent aminotransferase family protein [Bacillota bacterium]